MMEGEDGPGVAPLLEEDGNATPLRSPAPSSSPSPTPTPSPSPGGASPVSSGAGEGVVAMDEGQSPPVVRNGGASAMSNNVSF